MCYMTHSYVWHDLFICVTWLIHICDMTHSYVSQDWFICVTWLNSFVCVTWPMRMCDMFSFIYVYVTCSSSWYVYVTYIIHICDIYVTYSWYVYVFVICICHIYHSYMWHVLIHICDMITFLFITRNDVTCVTWSRRSLLQHSVSFIGLFCKRDL